MSSKPVQRLDRVVIRFAGDSGDRDEDQARVIQLHDGEPVRVGADQVVARGDSGYLTVVAAEGADPSRVLTHHVDAEDPSAFPFSRLDTPSLAHVPKGLFRNVSRPTYDDLGCGQVDGALTSAGARATDTDLTTLLYGQGHLDRRGVTDRHRPRTGHTSRHTTLAPMQSGVRSPCTSPCSHPPAPGRSWPTASCGPCSSSGRCLPPGASSLGAVRCSTTRMSRVPWNFGGDPLIVKPR